MPLSGAGIGLCALGGAKLLFHLLRSFSAQKCPRQRSEDRDLFGGRGRGSSSCLPSYVRKVRHVVQGPPSLPHGYLGKEEPMGPAPSSVMQSWWAARRLAWVSLAETPSSVYWGAQLGFDCWGSASLFRTKQPEVPGERQGSSLVSVPLSPTSLFYSLHFA